MKFHSSTERIAFLHWYTCTIQERMMPVTLPVFYPFPSAPFFPSGNTQLWGKQTLLYPNFLEERHLKYKFAFPPLSFSVLKKNEYENKMPVQLSRAWAFCGHSSSFLPLTYLQHVCHCSFWTTPTTACKRILLPLCTNLPSDAAAPPAGCILISLPKLQNLSVGYNGSWPLEFKPDEWCL